MIFTIAGGIVLGVVLLNVLTVILDVGLASLVLAWDHIVVGLRVVLLVALALVILTHLVASLEIVAVVALIAGALALALGIVRPGDAWRSWRARTSATHAERLEREIAAAQTAGRS